MTSCPIGVREVLEEMRVNWPQAHLDCAEVIAPLYRCRDLFFGRSKAIMAEHDLTPGEFEALAMLRKMPQPHRLTPSELCKGVWLTSGGMSKALNGLEERGLISREVDPADRRSRIVQLSDRGRALIEEVMQAILAGHAGILSRTLSAGEREQLVSLLGKLTDALEEA